MSGGEGDLHQKCLSLGEKNESHPNFVVGMGSVTKYDIRKQDIGQLYEHYCKLVEMNYDDLCLAEIPESVTPVIFKLLLRFRTNDDFEIPGDDFLTRFVYLSQQVLIQNLQVNDSSNDLTCFVSESTPLPSRNGQHVMIGYQFQFPYIKCDRALQRDTLRRHLIKRLDGADVRPYISGAMGTWDDIIDENIYEGSVPMYGSRSNVDSPHLEFQKTIKPLKEEEVESGNYIEYDLGLWNSCNPKNHSFVERGIIADVHMFDSRKEIDFWLPVILSMFYHKRETLPRRRDKNAGIEDVAPSVRTDITSFAIENDVIQYSKIDIIKIFVGMWKPDRINSLQCCMNLGEAIYDAYEGCEDGAFVWYTILDKMVQSSGMCPDFLKVGVKNFCDTYYYTFRLDRITCKTIACFARKDSREQYEAWHTAWCLKTLEVACNGWDYNVARALYRANWLDFLCYYSGKRVVWMVFQRHRLCETPNGTTLRKLMSEQFYNLFLKLIQQVSTQMMDPAKSEYKSHGEEIIRNANNTLRLLRTDGSKSAFMRQAVEFFLHTEFENLKDTNPELLGMPNGVLVTSTSDAEIREGMIEDYITRTIAVPYRGDFTWESEHVKDVMRWMEQMFPDPEMLHYFKKMLASILRGGNTDKKLFAFTGAKGNNAKTTWVRALDAVLGCYCVKTPIALLTRGPGEANGPSPATARLEGTRLNVFEEAEHNIPLREGTMKHMTGNDKMYARGLKKSGKDIELMCKTWFVCNVMPSVQGGGGNALRNRFVNIPCDTIWSNNPPATEDEQWAQRHFKIDRFFDIKLKYLAPALFWIMVQCYAVYAKEGLEDEPRVSVEATQRYWEENDPYYQFISERLEKVYVDVTDINGVKTRVLDDRVILDVETMHNEFSNWYRVTFPANRRIPDRPTLRKEICNRIPGFDNCGWPHIQIKKVVQKAVLAETFRNTMNTFTAQQPSQSSNTVESISTNMAFDRTLMAY